MKLSIDWKLKAAILRHGTWLFFIRLCRDLDGRWQREGKNLPLFGSMDEERFSKKQIDEYTLRTRTQRWRQWWAPYAIIGFVQNTHDLLEVSKPETLVN